MDSKCQYPIGDGPPYNFCREKAEIGSYCLTHHKLCYKKTDSEQPKKIFKLWK